ncbi:MAG: hypothetical protein WC792_06275 [Candidatus Micrarchaeia archaeon]
MPGTQRNARRKPIARALGRIASAVNARLAKRKPITEQAARNAEAFAKSLAAHIAGARGFSEPTMVSTPGAHEIRVSAPPAESEKHREQYDALATIICGMKRKPGVGVAGVGMAEGNGGRPQFRIRVKAMPILRPSKRILEMEKFEETCRKIVESNRPRQ